MTQLCSQETAIDTVSHRIHDVNATAGLPTPIRCVADGSGFPSPNLRVTIGTRDVTAHYFRQTTTAFFEPPAMDNSQDSTAAPIGLRLIKYRTELIAKGLVVEANDDGATMRCSTTSTMSQQSPPSGWMNEAEQVTENAAIIDLHVFC